MHTEKPICKFVLMMVDIYHVDHLKTALTLLDTVGRVLRNKQYFRCNIFIVIKTSLFHGNTIYNDSLK